LYFSFNPGIIKATFRQYIKGREDNDSDVKDWADCSLPALSVACFAKPCAPARPITPPVVHLQDVPEPAMGGNTNGDLLQWAWDLQSALQLSNEDKAELRKWLASFQPADQN